MYSLVVPVYRNAATIGALLDAVESLSQRLGGGLEAVFVVDGSPDESYALLREGLAQRTFASELVALSRNFGSFAAIRMGLSVGRGPYYAVMAADLQEPPELVAEFFAALRDEPIDVVVGTRSGRDDPWLSALASRVFWGLYRRFVQPDIPPGGVDVFGCTRQVRDALLRLEESNGSLVGLLFWIGFRRKTVAYRRLRRSVGRSGWTLRRRVRYLMDSVFSFTDLPISILLAIGGAGIAVALVGGLVVSLFWLFGLVPVPGYTPIILALFLSLGSTLFSLGIVGQYVWRAFENTKRRPLFVPMMHESFGKERER